MTRWITRTFSPASPEILALTDGRPLVAGRLALLGFDSADDAVGFLDPNRYTPASPYELPDMDAAVERLHDAFRRRERILVWGDFDVDGQTSTSLLLTGLRGRGSEILTHVPLRQTEGHGVAQGPLERWLQRGVDLIVTCDTGITDHAAVELAARAGVDVIVTDHHTLGDSLPPAFAVVNPMRLPATHALRDLPGVGVAYELITALDEGQPDESLLELAALGIVADVALQRRDTRYLLQRGLQRLRQTERPGLLALLERAGIEPAGLTETDIGFGLGPRLNAQGRLGDASASVELLTTSDPARAAELANQLEGMNARRKTEMRLIEASARSLIEREPALLEYAVLVLSHPEWAGGVVGIVASRLAETYHRPVILLNEQGEVASGSARSVEGCNITEALRRCSDLLTRFGGHALAAGLSLPTERIYDFRRRLSQIVRATCAAPDAEAELTIDAWVGLSELTPDFIEALSPLTPFGPGNPPLILAAGDVTVASARPLGRSGDHAELRLEEDAGGKARVLWWNRDDAPLPDGRVDIAFTARAGRGRDAGEVTLELVAIRGVGGAALGLAGETAHYDVVDRRGEPDWKAARARLESEYPGALWWAEGDGAAGLPRSRLDAAETLIVWHAPPDPECWQQVLERVQPNRVIVVCAPAPSPTADELLRTTAGLAKFVLREHDGRTTLDELAGRTGQSVSAMRAALRCLAEAGALRAEIDADGGVRLSTVGVQTGDGRQARRALNLALDETAAYRRYFSLDKRF